MRNRSPGPRFLLKIEAWLRNGAVIPAAAPAGQGFVLSTEERAQLTGHISLIKPHELRERFGATPELLARAAGGEHLAPEVIARLRGALANGVAAE